MILKIDEKSNIPNYLQLIMQIKEKIFSGVLKENDQLPSIRNLAKELNIAIITIKRAYDDLEREGYVETRQGKGCFVKKVSLNKLKDLKEQETSEKLKKIIEEAKKYGLSNDELKNIINSILED